MGKHFHHFEPETTKRVSYQIVYPLFGNALPVFSRVDALSTFDQNEEQDDSQHVCGCCGWHVCWFEWWALIGRPQFFLRTN